MLDHIDHAARQQVFRLLETLRQLLADGLLHDARAGRPDEGTRFGDVHITQLSQMNKRKKKTMGYGKRGRRSGVDRCVSVTGGLGVAPAPCG
jgi:hypothetical protein